MIAICCARKQSPNFISSKGLLLSHIITRTMNPVQYAIKRGTAHIHKAVIKVYCLFIVDVNLLLFLFFLSFIISMYGRNIVYTYNLVLNLLVPSGIFLRTYPPSIWEDCYLLERNHIERVGDGENLCCQSFINTWVVGSLSVRPKFQNSTKESKRS